MKLYYEIDEAQHGSDQHKIKDEHRQREIVDATDFIEKNKDKVEILAIDDSGSSGKFCLVVKKLGENSEAQPI